MILPNLKIYNFFNFDKTHFRIRTTSSSKATFLPNQTDSSHSMERLRYSKERGRIRLLSGKLDVIFLINLDTKKTYRIKTFILIELMQCCYLQNRNQRTAGGSVDESLQGERIAWSDRE